MKKYKIARFLTATVLFVLSISILVAVIATLKVSYSYKKISEIDIINFGKRKISLKIPVEYKPVRREKNTRIFQAETGMKASCRIEYNTENNDVHLSLFTSTLGGFAAMSFTYEIKNKDAKDKILELIFSEGKINLPD